MLRNAIDLAIIYSMHELKYGQITSCTYSPVLGRGSVVQMAIWKNYNAEKGAALQCHQAEYTKNTIWEEYLSFFQNRIMLEIWTPKYIKITSNRNYNDSEGRIRADQVVGCNTDNAKKNIQNRITES